MSTIWRQTTVAHQNVCQYVLLTLCPYQPPSLEAEGPGVDETGVSEVQTHTHYIGEGKSHTGGRLTRSSGGSSPVPYLC